jgi:hypothetical protein
MKIITDLNEANNFLQSYNSAQLEIMIYSPTLRRIALRLRLPKMENVAYIVGVGCQNICGDFRINDSNLKIEQKLNEFSEIITTISDEVSRFHLTTNGGFSLAYGFESEFGTSFDNFLQG